MKPNNGLADTMLLGFVPQHQPTIKSISMSNVIDNGLFRILQSTNRDYVLRFTFYVLREIVGAPPRRD